MLKINDSYVSADVKDIIVELKKQTELNGIKLFYKSFDTPYNYMVCCPFHKDGQEKKPSMGIHKQTGVCHCFACGWTGHITELISNVFGYDDFGNFGVRWITKNFSGVVVENRKDIELDFGRKVLGEPFENNYVSEEELSKYRYFHPYMYKRKLTDEVIDLFDIGYDEQTNCITFPVRDVNGHCLFVARRSVKTKYFNYPSGVEKPLYGIYELVVSMKHYDYVEGNWDLIVCESMIDSLNCWAYGKYAVALNGTGNQLQIKQLQELPCRKIILATDNDAAGIKARQKLAKALPYKVVTQYILPDDKKDINELSKEEFEKLSEVFC